MARRSRLTPKLQADIVARVKAGVPASVAARAAGLGQRTYFDWMRRGEDARRGDDGETLTNPADRPYAAFAEAVRDAEAFAEASSVVAIKEAGQKSWQAHAWFLERRYPDRYGRRDQLRTEISGPGGGPLNQRIELDIETELIAFFDERATLMGAVDTMRLGRGSGGADTDAESEVPEGPEGGALAGWLKPGA